jgi:lipopolysaccharide/colanic/teichoic acid biosynthesis glycosyltransferase
MADLGNLEKIKMPLAKRLFDILGSIFALILFTPVWVLIILAMIAEQIFFPSSRGSIFYSETRISAGKEFQIFKFRIFKNSVLASLLNERGCIETKALERNHANLTYIGRVLRRTYLDELPQFINILIGDMSLVGPRPTNICNSEKLLRRGNYSKYIIKSGLTGYFQAAKAKKFEHSEEELDRSYIEFCQKNSAFGIVLNDMKVILKTFKPWFRAEGI